MNRHALTEGDDRRFVGAAVRERGGRGSVFAKHRQRCCVPQAELGFEPGARRRYVAHRQMPRRDMDFNGRNVIRR